MANMDFSGIASRFSAKDAFDAADQAVNTRLQQMAFQKEQQRLQRADEKEAATTAILQGVRSGVHNLEEAAGLLIDIDPNMAKALRTEVKADKAAKRTIEKEARAEMIAAIDFVGSQVPGVESEAALEELKRVTEIRYGHLENFDVNEVLPSNLDELNAVKGAWTGEQIAAGDYFKAARALDEIEEIYGVGSDEAKAAKKDLEVLDQEMAERAKEADRAAEKHRVDMQNAKSSQDLAFMKLQRARDAISVELDDPTLTPKERARLIRNHNELEAKIKKDSTITGQTPEDVASRGSITGTQQGKVEVELREKKIGVEIFDSMTKAVIQELTETPDANTAMAALARFGVNVAAEARALSRRMDIDTSAVNLDPDKFSGDLGDLAKANKKIQSLGLQMAFAMAVQEGQTGKALSDRDLENFIRIIGMTDSDPRLIISHLQRLNKQNQENFIIRWKNVRPDTPFEGFIFSGETGTPGESKDTERIEYERLKAKMGLKS